MKPIAVVIAGILAWGAGRRSGGHFAPDYGWRIGVGLVFSAIGDINLELSEAYPTAFKIGLVSFLIGMLFHALCRRLWHLRFGALLMLPAVQATSFTCARSRRSCCPRMHGRFIFSEL